MSESIVNMERAHQAESATIHAAHNLQRAGLEDATSGSSGGSDGTAA